MQLAERKDFFIQICQAVQGVGQEEAEQIFEVEKFNYLKTLEEGGDYMKSCTDLSKMAVFFEVINNGLSFGRLEKQVYLIPRSFKTAKGYEKRLTYQITAQGLVLQAVRSGAIHSCQPPVIVYDGDEIAVKTVENRTIINHSAAIPRSEKIIGGFVVINVSKDITTAFWFDIKDILRLEKYSEKMNRGKANALYNNGEDGQIDVGFLKTKIVKAALKNFRKTKIGENEIDEIEF